MEQLVREGSRIRAPFKSLLTKAETSEGLEQCFALQYWGRIRFLHNLRTLLQKSSTPRVLSVLAGGYEGPLNEDDLGLEKSWTIKGFVTQAATMMTLVFYRFAQQNPHFTLIHAWPGYVATADRTRKPKPDASASFLWRWIFAGLQQLVLFVSLFRNISVEESGQRHVFLLANNKFGPGVWRIDEYSEVSPHSELLEQYRKVGKPDEVWDFTVATWDRALATGGK